MNISKHYKKLIKKYIKNQTNFKTKFKTKKTPFKIKKFYYTNSTQYHCHQNQISH